MDCFIGIDISKARLDVCVWPTCELRTFGNDAAGVAEFVTYARDLDPNLVAFEHTGRLSRDLIDQLVGEGIPSVLVDPRKVRAFATVVGREAKTDKLDATLIARFSALVRPNLSRIATTEAHELQELITRRVQIVAERRRELTRRTQQSGTFCVTSIDRHLAWLKDEAGSLEGEIRKRVAERPEWRRRFELLTSMPGIGPAVAHTLIAHLPELGHHDARRIVGLIGLAPVARESGTVIHRRRTGYGRIHVRTALFMASVVATRYNPVIRSFHARLTEAGKPKMVARVAAMRKMLTILNTMIRNDTPWSEDAAERNTRAGARDEEA